MCIVCNLFNSRSLACPYRTQHRRDIAFPLRDLPVANPIHPRLNTEDLIKLAPTETELNGNSIQPGAMQTPVSPATVPSLLSSELDSGSVASERTGNRRLYVVNPGELSACEGESDDNDKGSVEEANLGYTGLSTPLEDEISPNGCAPCLECVERLKSSRTSEEYLTSELKARDARIEELEFVISQYRQICEDHSMEKKEIETKHEEMMNAQQIEHSNQISELEDARLDTMILYSGRLQASFSRCARHRENARSLDHDNYCLRLQLRHAEFSNKVLQNRLAYERTNSYRQDQYNFGTQLLQTQMAHSNITEPRFARNWYQRDTANNHRVFEAAQRQSDLGENHQMAASPKVEAEVSGFLHGFEVEEKVNSMQRDHKDEIARKNAEILILRDRISAAEAEKTLQQKQIATEKSRADLHKRELAAVFHELATMQITIRQNLGVKALREIRLLTVEKLMKFSTLKDPIIERIYDVHLQAMNGSVRERDVRIKSDDARLENFVEAVLKRDVWVEDVRDDDEDDENDQCEVQEEVDGGNEVHDGDDEESNSDSSIGNTNEHEHEHESSGDCSSSSSSSSSNSDNETKHYGIHYRGAYHGVDSINFESGSEVSETFSDAFSEIDNRDTDTESGIESLSSDDNASLSSFVSLASDLSAESI